jgi:DamX protein
MTGTVNDASLDPQRLADLGLSHDPFAAGGAYFSDESVETRLNLAVHLLQATGRLVLLSGRAGIGRSDFLRQIAAHATGLVCTGVSGGADTDLRRLLSGLDAEGPTGVLERLRGASTRHALLLDDADLIPRTVLTELIACHEAVTIEGLEWPVVLSCREESLDELQRLLFSHGYDEDLTETLHLPPFTEQQTRAYVQERLAAAGDASGALLSERQIQRIHERSDGIPALINDEARAALAGSGSGRSWLPRLPAMPRSVLAGSAIVALAAAVTLPLVWWLSAEPEAPTTRPLELAPRGEIVRAYEPEQIREPAAGEDVSRAPQPAPLAPAEPESGTRDTGSAAPLAGSQPEMDDSAAVASAQAEVTAAPLLPEPETDPAASPAPIPETTATGAPTSQTSQPETEDAAGVQPVSQQPGDWLASRDPDHYTLQLIGGREQATVDRFFALVGQDERMHVVDGRRDGHQWLVVVTGDYPTAEAARAALQELPESWRQYGAFPRSFASLQR